MKSIFASRKGRVAKKLSIVVAVLSVAMFLINGYISGERETNQVAAAEAAQQEEDQRPEVDGRVIYGQGTERDDQGNPVPGGSSATPSASGAPTTPSGEQDTEAVVTAQVREQAQDFGEAWTTYDYASPTALENLPGTATSGDMRTAYDSWLAGMRSRQERSSGTVNSVSINQLNYSGTADVGTGTATVTVGTTSTVANSQVGTSGSEVQQNYVLTMTRDDQSGTYGDSDYRWVITNVTAQ